MNAVISKVIKAAKADSKDSCAAQVCFIGLPHLL